MALQLIRKYGEPILRKKAMPVDDFGPEVQHLVVDLTETMQANGGIGLAANQIGRSEFVCVVDEGLITEGAGVRVFVNPRIVEEAAEEYELEEGCLSIPEVNDAVWRKRRSRLRYQDVQGVMHDEWFADLFARVLQHEVDHLNGIFFVDRLSSVRRKLLGKRLKAIAEQAQQEMSERQHQRASVD